MTVNVIRAVHCLTIFNFFFWKVFHCVHFECPANQKEPSICGSDRTDSSEQSVMSADTTISSIM